MHSLNRLNSRKNIISTDTFKKAPRVVPNLAERDAALRLANSKEFLSVARRNFLQGAAALSAPAFLRTVHAAQTAHTAKIGIALPFTGVQAAVADDMRKGYELAFKQAAAYGVAISAVFEDDKTDAKETARIIKSFAGDSSIVASTGIVGTPHAKASLPAAIGGGLPLIGIRSGADELRQGQKGVRHLRVSFNQELRKQMEMIAGISNYKLAVVYSDDDFGKAAFAFVKEEAIRLNLLMRPPVAAERNGANIEKATTEALGPDMYHTALLVLMISKPMQAAVKHARDNLKFSGPTFCMGFCATRQFVESKEQSLTGLGLIATFPVPKRALFEMTRNFNTLADKAGLANLQNSLTAFEAFFYGSVIAAGVSRCKDAVTRTALVSAVHNISHVQNLPISFDQEMVGFRHMEIVVKSGSRLAG